jgi:antirestriction protein ArdC
MENQEKNEAYSKLTPERKELVDKVLENLKNGTGFWKQGWRYRGTPESGITGKKYHGINNLFLTLVAMERNYQDNRWITYNQMVERDWSFKRADDGRSAGKNAGVVIEFFELRDKETKKPFDRRVLDGMTDEESQEYMDQNVYPIRKYYRVFNGDLIDGIPEKEVIEQSPFQPNERAERFLAYWDAHESPIIHGGSSAYYDCKRDEVHLPPKESFLSVQEYYSTALHETGHSTGNEKRLNRDIKNVFGSKEYAIEELRAQIASMFLVQEFDIQVDDGQFKNDSAYLKSWYEEISNDPNVLFTAIADADRICKYVMEKEKLAGSVKEAEPMEVKSEQEKEEIPKEVAALIPPSEVAVRSVHKSKTVDMDGRGIESLRRMADRDIVERASKTKSGDKFQTLYQGGSLFENEEKNERSLMARIAMFCNGNKEQLLRIFKSSGQYHDDKPNAFYDVMATQSLQFVSKARSERTKKSHQNRGHFGANAKT